MMWFYLTAMLGGNRLGLLRLLCDTRGAAVEFE